MNEKEFAAAIKANPHDEGLRFQYADWLIEKGRDEEAIRQRALAVSRKIELYTYYDDNACAYMMSNTMPLWVNSGWESHSDSKTETIFDEFFDIFGIKKPKNTEVVRLVMAIESVDNGEVEIKMTFKPFAKTQPATKRKRS